eukprot:scaffold307583_cov32-Tisochrysis_lutea.AAC.9
MPSISPCASPSSARVNIRSKHSARRIAAEHPASDMRASCNSDSHVAHKERCPWPVGSRPEVSALYFFNSWHSSCPRRSAQSSGLGQSMLRIGRDIGSNKLFESWPSTDLSVAQPMQSLAG